MGSVFVLIPIDNSGGRSNLLGYLHHTPLQLLEFYLWYSLPSLKVDLVELLVKLVPLPDESYRWSGTCRQIQWVVGALVVLSSTRLGSWISLPVRHAL